MRRQIVKTSDLISPHTHPSVVRMAQLPCSACDGLMSVLRFLSWSSYFITLLLETHPVSPCNIFSTKQKCLSGGSTLWDPVPKGTGALVEYPQWKEEPGLYKDLLANMKASSKDSTLPVRAFPFHIILNTPLPLHRSLYCYSYLSKWQFSWHYRGERVKSRIICSLGIISRLPHTLKTFS